MFNLVILIGSLVFFIAAVKIMQLFHKKRFKEEFITVAAPNGTLVVPLAFVPIFIEAKFLDIDHSSCTAEPFDSIDIGIVQNGIKLTWSVKQARRVFWKASAK